MDIKTLMFLKAMQVEEDTGEPPIYFSAVGIARGGTPVKTNSYGTTIDTTSADNNRVVVTQVYDSSYAAANYHNGYVAIGFEHLTEWIDAGKTLIFDADIDVSANPTQTASFTIYIRDKLYSASFGGGKIHAEFSNIGTQNKHYVEFRCMGCSFTLSNVKLTAE